MQAGRDQGGCGCGFGHAYRHNRRRGIFRRSAHVVVRFPLPHGRVEVGDRGPWHLCHSRDHFLATPGPRHQSGTAIGRRLVVGGQRLVCQHLAFCALFNHRSCGRGDPRLGGSVVDWIAYGHAVQTTKDRSKFGKGEVRGVIGPESSNNAKEGGGLVPTLLFGIPGSGSMAIFIGAIALLGSGQIEVGPAMLKNNLDITYAIVWLLALANVVGTVICIAASGGIAKLTTIRFVLLAPFLFMIISFAAFQSGQNLMDLVALFAIGFLGIFMRRFDWSRPAFLIGFVLATPAETYANQAVQIAASRFRKSFGEGIEYMFSPIVIVLLIITVISVVLGLRQAKHIMAEGDVKSGSKRAPLMFLLLLTGYIAYALFDAASIPSYSRDRVFPMFVASICLIGCAVLIIRMMLKPETDVMFADRETNGEDADATHGLWTTLGWFAGLLVLTALLGFILALVIFLFSFMRLRAGLSIAFAALYTAGGIAFICVMAWLLNRDFPPGLLQEFFDLPWPLT